MPVIATEPAGAQRRNGKTLRYPDLDALRGIAALVVVVFHYLVMWHSPAAFDTGLRSVLYPLVAGHEAVVLFFLLSGFVLALPLLAGDQMPYPRYALRRVLRIYGPYLVALLLSVAGDYFWHRPDGFGRWSGKTWSEPVSTHLLLQHILFLGNYESNQFNLAFWSLITELRVSLIFPWLFAMTQRMKSSTAIVIAVLSSGLGTQMRVRDVAHKEIWATLAYIGVFMCGILLARHIEEIREVLAGNSRAVRSFMFVGSILLYHEGHKLSLFPFIWRFSEWPTVLGSVGFIVLGIDAAFLRRSVFQFFGRISYSIYLVHGTVLFLFAVLLGARLSRLYYFPPLIMACVVASYLFWLAVENPFVGLSRAVGHLKDPSANHDVSAVNASLSSHIDSRRA